MPRWTRDVMVAAGGGLVVWLVLLAAGALDVIANEVDAKLVASAVLKDEKLRETVIDNLANDRRITDAIEEEVGAYLTPERRVKIEADLEAISDAARKIRTLQNGALGYRQVKVDIHRNSEPHETIVGRRGEYIRGAWVEWTRDFANANRYRFVEVEFEEPNAQGRMLHLNVSAELDAEPTELRVHVRYTKLAGE